MAKSAVFPSSDYAKRVGAIMHRQPTTAWNEIKEVKPFRRLYRLITEDDLKTVERYYRVNWPPRTGTNHLRHDLATLINNWQGEVDRARAWCTKHPPKAPAKIIEFPVQAQSNEWTDEEREKSEAQRQKLAELKKALKG